MTAESPSIPPKTYALELVRLLVQVAWADHEVAPAEAEGLLAFARRSGLAQTELDELSAMLSGRIPLVPPNLGLLRPSKAEIHLAVRTHGPASGDPNVLQAQLGAFNGGCPPNACMNVQVSVHQP